MILDEDGSFEADEFPLHDGRSRILYKQVKRKLFRKQKFRATIIVRGTFF